jgi:hypothetical protein
MHFHRSRPRTAGSPWDYDLEHVDSLALPSTPKTQSTTTRRRLKFLNNFISKIRVNLPGLANLPSRSSLFDETIFNFKRQKLKPVPRDEAILLDDEFDQTIPAWAGTYEWLEASRRHQWSHLYYPERVCSSARPMVMVRFDTWPYV